MTKLNAPRNYRLSRQSDLREEERETREGFVRCTRELYSESFRARISISSS